MLQNSLLVERLKLSINKEHKVKITASGTSGDIWDTFYIKAGLMAIEPYGVGQIPQFELALTVEQAQAVYKGLGRLLPKLESK